MTHQPLISVILTTYNRPQELVNALRSLSRQTYANFEVLVVNTGGGDVAQLVDNADTGHPLTTFQFSEHTHPSIARNKALRAAQGEYIAYLEDKDLFYPRHLEHLVTFLQDNPNIGAAYTDAHQGKPFVFASGLATVRKEDLPARNFDRLQLLVSNYIPFACMMHRSSCLEQAGMFDESLAVLEDWELWIRISKLYPIRRIPIISAQVATPGTIIGAIATSDRNPLVIDTLLTIYRKHEIASSENTLLAHMRMHHIIGMYRDLAEQHETDNEFEQAESLWQRIAELSGRPEDLLRLGMLRQKMGKEDQARLTLNLANELRYPRSANGD